MVLQWLGLEGLAVLTDQACLGESSSWGWVRSECGKVVVVGREGWL